jgi:hypothetical protein
MLATEYYWERAGQALAKADQSTISECFVSIAMIYQSLAKSEGELHRRFPNIPPRHIDGTASRRLATITKSDVVVQPSEPPVPDVARGWGAAGQRFNVLISRVVPKRP